MAASVPVQVLNQFTGIPPEAYVGGQRNNAYGMQFVTKAQVEAAPNTSIGHIFGLTGGFGPQPGKAAVIRGFFISSQKVVTIQIRVGFGTGPLQNVNIPEMDMAAVVGPEGVYLPCNWVIRNGRSVSVNCLNFMNASDTDTWIGVSPDAYYITDDFNFDARRCISWVGTSITNGSGPTSTAYLYHNQAKDYLRKQGLSIRHELNGISGSTSTVHYTIFNQGGYDTVSTGVPPDLLIIELAVNDASANVPVNTSIANYTSYVDRMLNHPEKANIKVAVLGSTPLENNTASSNALTLDAALSSLVTTYNNNPTYLNRVFYIPLSNSFNRLDASKYASSDTPGARIHPSDSGSTDIFNNGFVPFFNSAQGQILIEALK